MVTQEVASGSRVTPLELFFDLVFVFTITQLTSLLARDATWTAVFQAAVIFGSRSRACSKR
ncbi:MAG: low temperature requirement protein A [Chloroflexi bacterium]|nr:MAG: low temperature requirement protein A [Chloroflexota bacterium]